MKIFCFLVTFLESGLSLFDIRSPFETQPYRVVAQLPGGVEIRPSASPSYAATRLP